MSELSVTVSRRAALKVAVLIVWTAIRAYVDGSKTVTFSMGSDE